MFPTDRYTPHGYLDNRSNCWKISPGGVFRSRPAVGMGWHFPSFAGAYNSTFIYQTDLRLEFSFQDNDKVVNLLNTEDFLQAGINLYSDYHSKNIFRLKFEILNSLAVTACFFPGDERGDVLLCLVKFENHSQHSVTFSFNSYLDYKRDLNKSLTWGSEMFRVRREGGITPGTSYHSSNQAPLETGIEFPHRGASIGVFQEGTVFHLLQGWLPGQVNTNSYNLASPSNGIDKPIRKAQKFTPPFPAEETGSRIVHQVEGIGYRIHIEPAQSLTLLNGVARGESELQAVKKIEPYFIGSGEKASKVQAQLERQDDIFWESAPKLGGDWPEYIRRGSVYDFETLRSLVRKPIGIYKHPWDAMQLQVPRTVLAEAVLDMLILSYADPETAKAVIYGTFADAPEPNIPCSREDGSYNMVAIDGSPCGTAPEWCFPFHCINQLYLRTGDKEWLGKLFPLLAKFLEFWAANRRDKEGRPFYKCSWEAGQDNSARFGIKDDPSGGGALVEHIWPVDLQAALAQAYTLMANWSLDLELDSKPWWKQASIEKERLGQLWQNGWFHDYDLVKKEFTDVIDTMQLAPVLCGQTTPEQIDQLSNRLTDPPAHGQIFHALMWPSVAFCLIEGCSESGYLSLAASHSWKVINSVYRWLDSNPANVDNSSGGLPGVGREYWPQIYSTEAEPPKGGGGAEVYGWGCLTTLLLFRYIIGFREEAGRGSAINFSLHPALPPELIITGRTYTAGPFIHRKCSIVLVYRPTNVPGQLQIGITATFLEPFSLVARNEKQTVIYSSSNLLSKHQIIVLGQNDETLFFESNTETDNRA